MKKTIIYLMAALGLSACGHTDEFPDDPADSRQVAVSLAVSRAGNQADAPSTYRVLLFDIDKVYKNITGTYCYNFTDADVTPISGTTFPCGVDELGNPTGRDVYAGVYAPADSYYMVVSSPAVPYAAPSAVSDKKGLFYRRKPEKGKTHLSVSEPFMVTLLGRGGYVDGVGKVVRDTVTIGQTPDGSYINPLRERRSKIKFVFRCGDDITSSSISRVSLDNLITDAWYDPISHDFISGNYDSSMTTDFAELSESEFTVTRGGKEVPLPAPSKAEDEDREYVYVLSQKYSRLDENKRPFYVLPVLHVEFGEGVVNMPLAFDFEEMHSYTYYITINSLFMNISLKVMPWDNCPDISSDLDYPPVINIGIVPLSWTGINGGSSAIE